MINSRWRKQILVASKYDMMSLFVCQFLMCIVVFVAVCLS